MFMEVYLEPSQTSKMELFFTSVKAYFLNVLNLIELRLRYIFLQNSSFREKTYNSENFWRKSIFLTMEQFIFEIMQCNGVITKNEQRSLFKLVSVKNVKTACVCNVFFFYYFKNYG